MSAKKSRGSSKTNDLKYLEFADRILKLKKKEVLKKEKKQDG